MDQNTTTAIADKLAIPLEATKATRGEKFFDFFTYKVVNFGLNEIFSLAIVDWFLGGTDKSTTKSVYDTPTSYFANKIGGKAIAVSDALRATQDKLSKTFIGNTGAAVFTLNMGGHFAAALVKVLEDSREKLTRKFDIVIDSFTNTKLSAADIAERETRYEMIKNKPTKSGWDIAKGRIAGVIASIAITQIPETFDKNVVKREATENQYGFRRGSAFLGKKIEDGLNAAREKAGKPALEPMAQRRQKYWSELLLFETFCTWVTSRVMEVVVKWKDKPSNITAPPAPAQPQSTSNETKVVSADSVPLSKSAVAFANEPEQGEKSKKWADKSYDYNDEVGIQV